MDVNKLMSSMQGTDYEAILKNLESMGGPMKNALMIASVLSIVIGLLWCFFGLKLIRVWAAILGLALGFGIGTGVAAAFNLSSNLILICGAVGGILLAILGAVFYHVGVFLIAWITGSSLALLVLRPKDWKLALACAGIGLVVALFTIRFAELIIIVITGINGGMSAGTGIISFLPFDNQIVRYAVIGVLVVAGIAVQLLMESGKRKKRTLGNAKKIREQNSTANEVEKARAMIDELDKKPAAAKKGTAGKNQKKKKAAPKKNKK